MRRSYLVWSWLLSPVCHASPHEFLQEVPGDYVQLGAAPQDQFLSLRFYLAELDKPYLKVAEEVSDPDSEQYGQYLEAHELRSILPDMSLASRKVTRWLEDEGLSNHTTNPERIDVTAAVADWDRVLNTTFLQFRHRATGRTVVRTTEYSVPATQKEVIDYIYPTVQFFRLSTNPAKVLKRQHIPTGPSNCSNSVCPAQLRTKYSINYSPPDGKSGSTIAIAGFLNNFPNVTDIKAFLTKYDKKNPKSIPAINVVSVNKGTLKPPADGGSLTVEAELDLDYSMAFTGPLPVSFYSVGGHAPKVGQKPSTHILPDDNEPYAEFFEYVLALKNPPKVISISYNDDEKNVPVAYAKRVCDLFAKAAARGISIVGSSGDGGAAGAGGDSTCLGVSGKKRLFVPTFPSSCPWMTSVGATADYGGVASFSSGGMSNVFKRPSWQDKAVTGYIKALKGKHKNYYNTTGRAQPDVSLLGDDYLTLTGGQASIHDGTSASAPVFAAMVALINDMRLREKKPVLGFLNPMLYSAKTNSAFRDVKDGSNSVGCADGNFFEPGWEALAGWDAATGLDITFHNGNDLIAQMRLGIQAQRAQEYAQGLPINIARKISDVLRRGTLRGAEVMRLDELIGSIWVGKKADIVLIRCDEIESLSVADPVGAVVFFTSLRHIDALIVNGKLRERNGELEVDYAGLKQEIKSHAAALKPIAAPFDSSAVRPEWLKIFKGEV